MISMMVFGTLSVLDVDFFILFMDVDVDVSPANYVLV